ncbi:helix-turn-helix domain-containing protein [Kocuria sp.]|uniref:helix-turn-helix domain-containing protein n=1 Tax=Kocuria sp. TaxID=1871328 RepID=UPI0026DEA87C|nr:helix-turn-helix transcriptional regulator [Kocuria sp.]MDO5618762.1 helix-turn-helix transcriptional regulator [Kocuria sp.]
MSADFKERFGTNLRLIRTAQKMTQQDLADLLNSHGLTRDKIAKIERGSRPTTVEEAAMIARKLDCTLDDLLMTSQDMSQRQLVRDLVEAMGPAVSKVKDEVGRLLMLHASLRHALAQDSGDDAALKDTFAWAANTAAQFPVSRGVVEGVAQHLGARRDRRDPRQALPELTGLGLAEDVEDLTRGID